MTPELKEELAAWQRAGNQAWQMIDKWESEDQWISEIFTGSIFRGPVDGRKWDDVPRRSFRTRSMPVSYR